MAASDIIIQGAREHNLQGVDLVLPRNKLICLTGVSGSGKSSLAFDTLYAEGQRRYVESLSTFARQFLGQMPKPDVDRISGLSPSISISQKSSGKNPRSTVGTITEIYDFLRVLYARVGQGHCPQCGEPITAQSLEQIIGRIESLPAKTPYMVLAPVARQQKGQFRDLMGDLRKQGFVRARVDGEIVNLGDELALDRQRRHDIDVVVDRLVAGPKVRSRLAEAVELALKAGDRSLVVLVDKGDGNAEEFALSADYACTPCGLSFDRPSPQLFSFNSPQGMCLECDGLGQMYSFDPKKLVTEPDKSFAQGCIELLGRWKDLGRWKRHIYAGVAETVERKCELAEGTMLETPWERADTKTCSTCGSGAPAGCTSRTPGAAGPIRKKYGGTFDGDHPRPCLERYRDLQEQIAILTATYEKYMDIIRCPDCEGQRLNPQARSVTLSSWGALGARREKEEATPSSAQRLAPSNLRCSELTLPPTLPVCRSTRCRPFSTA